MLYPSLLPFAMITSEDFSNTGDTKTYAMMLFFKPTISKLLDRQKGGGGTQHPESI